MCEKLKVVCEFVNWDSWTVVGLSWIKFGSKSNENKTQKIYLQFYQSFNQYLGQDKILTFLDLTKYLSRSKNLDCQDYLDSSSTLIFKCYVMHIIIGNLNPHHTYKIIDIATRQPIYQLQPDTDLLELE